MGEFSEFCSVFFRLKGTLSASIFFFLNMSLLVVQYIALWSRFYRNFSLIDLLTGWLKTHPVHLWLTILVWQIQNSIKQCKSAQEQCNRMTNFMALIRMSTKQGIITFQRSIGVFKRLSNPMNNARERLFVFRELYNNFDCFVLLLQILQKSAHKK